MPTTMTDFGPYTITTGATWVKVVFTPGTDYFTVDANSNGVLLDWRESLEEGGTPGTNKESIAEGSKDVFPCGRVKAGSNTKLTEVFVASVDGGAGTVIITPYSES